MNKMIKSLPPTKNSNFIPELIDNLNQCIGNRPQVVNSPNSNDTSMVTSRDVHFFYARSHYIVKQNGHANIVSQLTLLQQSNSP